MGEKARGSSGERLSRLGRDFNLAVGAIALIGSALIPFGGAAVGTYAAINFAQAGGFEIARRHFKKKRGGAKK